MSDHKFDVFAGVLVIGVLVIAFVQGCIVPVTCGINGFGPIRQQDITVNRLYVDHEEKKSSYMVGSDNGVFEVDNGVLLGVWNADELYASLKEGKTYHVTTKGNKRVGLFWQEYPYIISITTNIVSK